MDSHYNAIWWADSLARMIRQNVTIIAQFALVDEYGLMGIFESFPIYYVYRMDKHFGDQLVYANSDHLVSFDLASKCDLFCSGMVTRIDCQRFFWVKLRFVCSGLMSS